MTVPVYHEIKIIHLADSPRDSVSRFVTSGSDERSPL